jgi:hypothetical protein
MERADQQEVVEGRPTAVAPPPDVVRLGEPPAAAAGEPTLPVPVAHLAKHPRRRLAGDPAEGHDVTGGVLEHGLDAPVAQQPADRARMDRGPTLDLAPTAALFEAAQLRVDHHHRPVGIRVLGHPRRADRDEGVGMPRLDEVFLPRHRRHALGHPLDRSDHDRALGRRQLGVEPQPALLLDPPPRQRAGVLGLDDLLTIDASHHVTTVTDRTHRDAIGPRDQPRFRLGRGEARQLDHLVEAQTAAGERLRHEREPLERVPRDDPAPRLPPGDPVADRDPVRHVARTRVEPRLATIPFGDQREEPSLPPTGLQVHVVQGRDEGVARLPAGRNGRRVGVEPVRR